MSTTTNLAITEADENAICDLVALAQESQSDPEALTALHTAGTVVVNLAGRRVLDRETYAKAMADALAPPLRSGDGWRIALAQTTPILTPTSDDLG